MPNESSFQSLYLIKRELAGNPRPHPPKKRRTKDISREAICCGDINVALKKKRKKQHNLKLIVITGTCAFLLLMNLEMLRKTKWGRKCKKEPKALLLLFRIRNVNFCTVASVTMT